MKKSDYRCEACNIIFEVSIGYGESFPSFPICSECGSNNTTRKFSGFNIDIAEGKLGNAKSGYENNVSYHPSKYGKFKGKKV